MPSRSPSHSPAFGGVEDDRGWGLLPSGAKDARTVQKRLRLAHPTRRTPVAEPVHLELRFLTPASIDQSQGNAPT
jgi:hypothetical protein